MVTTPASKATPRYRLSEPGSGKQPDGTCLHWWRIDGGSGSQSWGICMHCKDGKWFDNVWNGWDTSKDDSSNNIGKTVLELGSL